MLTGFEPFSNWTENPSYEVVNSFNKQEINNHNIIAIKLPVAYKKIPEVIDRNLKEYEPDIDIMTGIAEGRNCINVEKIAINEVTARIPYNDGGHQPIEEKIIENGPDTYFTKLPAKKIVENLVKENIPSEVSYSTGTYACNQAFYYLMHKIKNEKIIGGFIHLPITHNMAAKIKTKKYASMNLEVIIKAMDITIRFLT